MVFISKMREKVEGGKAVLRLFERSVLIFPVAVTMLVGVALLGGGGISPWQWWVPVCGVLLLTLLTRKETLSRRVCACGLFLLLLGVVWCSAGLLAELEDCDNRAYHLPAIRLLIEGWNPIMVNTREALAQTMGVDLQEMRAWHVLFMARGTWFFNAAAYTFTHSSFGLLIPLFPFLFVAASGQLWRLLRPMPAWARVLGVVLLFLLAPSTTRLVDCVVGLAGVGLLCAMTRRLHREPGTVLALFCLSFWMIVSKQLGLLTCFVFWACFSVALLWREKGRAVLFLSKMAGGLLVAFCIVCASPYLTSWKHYGHPLYPAYTVDEAKFPTHDITWDFRECNDDARAMGHVGAFFYTYISPAVGRAYYNWKLGKKDFAPNRSTWWQNVQTENPTVPIPATTRWGFLLAFALVALLGGRRVRFYWIATAIALFCFPTAYLGYLRYTPWLAGLSTLGICYGGVCVWKALRGKTLWKGVLAGCATLGVIVGVTLQDGPMLVTNARMMQGQQQINDYLASRVSSTGTSKPQLKIPESRHAPGIADLQLLCKQVPKLRNAEIVILTEAEEPPKRTALYFFLPQDGEEAEAHNAYGEILTHSDRKERLIRYPLFILKAYTVTLPKLVWARVKSVFA